MITSGVVALAFASAMLYLWALGRFFAPRFRPKVDPDRPTFATGRLDRMTHLSPLAGRLAAVTGSVGGVLLFVGLVLKYA